MAEITAVVLCRDAGRSLTRTLDSLDAQTRPAAERLVVDLDSTDPATLQQLAAVERGGTRVLRVDDRSSARARNLALAATAAPYVTIVEAGWELEATYLESCAAELDSDSTLSFVGTAVAAPVRGLPEFRPEVGTVAAVLRGDWPPAASLFRRRDCEAVRGFDAELDELADVDLWIRLLGAGGGGRRLDESLLRSTVSLSPWLRAARSGYSSDLPRWLAKHGEAGASGAPPAASRAAFESAVATRRVALEAELAALRTERRALLAELAARGVAPLDLGDLRRTRPISPVWGLERGLPLDRRFIEQFLERHRDDIRGHVLEVKDDGYTRRFGGDRVERSDVLDRSPDNPAATLVADLTVDGALPAAAFDCLLLTQTVHLIYDYRSVLRETFRALRPGGTLLCTLPAVSRVDPESVAPPAGDFWRFTEDSARRLFAEYFPPEQISVEVFGNVLLAAAFLYGLAPDELGEEELDRVDPDFPLLVAVRARKPDDRLTLLVNGTDGGRGRGLVLGYHRIARLTPDPFGLCVARDDFRQHLAYLRDAWRPMPLAELVAAAGRGTVPDRAVAVTLDDGTLDWLEAAAPELEAAAVPATCFVMTSNLDEPVEPWWDLLDRIFASERPLPLELDLFVGDEKLALRTRGWRDYDVARREIHSRLLRLPAEPRDRALADLVAWCGLDLPRRDSHRTITGDELLRLAARPGLTIGAHSVHHPSLPALAPEIRRREIVDSRRTLEERLGRNVSLFCYPFGHVDAATVDDVRSAGFVAATLCEPGSVGPGIDPLRTPRLIVPPSSAAQLEAAMERLYRAGA